MDFKWIDRIAGKDPASANDINTVAHAVEALNEEIKSLPSGGGGGGGGTSGNVPTKLSELEADSISRSDQEPFDFSVYIADFNAHEMNFGVDNLTFRNMGYGSGVNFDGNVIHEVGAPEADTDGANKKYVDDAVNGIPSWAKQPTKPTYTAAEVGAIAKNQGSANVGKILVVGSDGNLVLADMPATGDVIGYIDENNNIIVQGDLADGTYVFKYEGASGTYTDIGSLVVGGVVEYSIIATLTECTAVSGNTTVINEGGTATLKYVAKDGFKLTDTITVSGASYTWDSATGTLVLSNPTSDVTISITATKSGATNIIDTVGYTDGKRLSTSTGNLTDADGYTTTGMINIPSTLPRPVTIRTDGVDFNKSTSCAIVTYSATEEKTGSTQLYNKGTTAFNGFTWSFDADGNMTMTYDSTYAVYFKICGYGSGADLIVTINEEIPK